MISEAAELTAAHEWPEPIQSIRGLADVNYAIGDIGAAIASGSFRTMGMIVAPCSARTCAEIATGGGSNLLTRAADVCLKERRRLVLMVRETPLHTGHLKAMLAASEIGAIIAPPAPAFYAKPASLEAMVDHSVGRILDLFESGRGPGRALDRALTPEANCGLEYVRGAPTRGWPRVVKKLIWSRWGLLRTVQGRRSPASARESGRPTQGVGTRASFEPLPPALWR